MSDIFREVEEEVRRERLEKIWKEYGDYIVAAVALVILAAAAFRLWTYYEARERARASNTYMAAQDLLQNGQPKAAAESFANLAKTAPSGYAKLSQLQEADALAASGNKAAALANYRLIAAQGDDTLSAIAKIRAAWILVEGAPKSDIESLVGPLAGDVSPWRPVAREILAYADYRAGATAQALAEFRALANDAKAPPGVRGRSNAMATFITAGGEKDTGTVAFPESAVTPKVNALRAVMTGSPPAAGGTGVAPAPSNGPSAPAPGKPSAPGGAAQTNSAPAPSQANAPVNSKQAATPTNAPPAPAAPDNSKGQPPK